MATKLSKVLAYNSKELNLIKMVTHRGGLPPITSDNPFNMCSREVTP